MAASSSCHQRRQASAVAVLKKAPDVNAPPLDFSQQRLQTARVAFLGMIEGALRRHGVAAAHDSRCGESGRYGAFTPDARQRGCGEMQTLLPLQGLRSSVMRQVSCDSAGFDSGSSLVASKLLQIYQLD